MDEVIISDYKQRMVDYYPDCVSRLEEFKAIIDGEYPEFENLGQAVEKVKNNAWLLTMEEDRIQEWEKALKIKPLTDSTLEDRRDVIVARMRGMGKLNTNLINTIVETFTNGKAVSWIKDSCLYVVITPPPQNKLYKFKNVESEIARRVPLHLGFNISRNYAEWQNIKDDFATWQAVKDDRPTWEDCYLYVNPDWLIR